jgi:hypothetical protein
MLGITTRHLNEEKCLEVVVSCDDAARESLNWLSRGCQIYIEL